MKIIAKGTNPSVHLTVKRTLNQVAFEADRENARHANMPLYFPTWEELPDQQKANWEIMAKRIAIALATECAEEVKALLSPTIEVALESEWLPPR